MGSRIDEFFKGVSTAITSNTIDLIILGTIVAAAIGVLAYVYYIYPKYNEIRFKRKMNNFVLKRYNLKEFEESAISRVISEHAITPEYMLFISQAVFEKHEKDILKALTKTCPPGISAEKTLGAIKDRFYN